MTIRRGLCLLSAMAFLCAACRNRIIPPQTPGEAAEYTDLTAGGKLRIVVPLMQSGIETPAVGTLQESGGSITFSAKNLVGFQISHYSIEGKGRRVRLKFLGAESNRDGRVSGEVRPPKLPFALPPKSEHVRLIYFVRSSQADHNMAIAASRKMDDLSEFTKSLRLDPSVCRVSGHIYCALVPVGVAVRPE